MIICVAPTGMQAFGESDYVPPQCLSFGTVDTSGMSEYEILRMAQINANKRKLAELGLEKLPYAADVAGSKSKKPAVKKPTGPAKKKASRVQPMRDRGRALCYKSNCYHCYHESNVVTTTYYH